MWILLPPIISIFFSSEKSWSSNPYSICSCQSRNSSGLTLPYKGSRVNSKHICGIGHIFWLPPRVVCWKHQHTVDTLNIVAEDGGRPSPRWKTRELAPQGLPRTPIHQVTTQPNEITEPPKHTTKGCIFVVHRKRTTTTKKHMTRSLLCIFLYDAR
jgi:hypothetical protein